MCLPLYKILWHIFFVLWSFDFRHATWQNCKFTMKVQEVRHKECHLVLWDPSLFSHNSLWRYPRPQAVRHRDPLRKTREGVKIKSVITSTSNTKSPWDLLTAAGFRHSLQNENLEGVISICTFSISWLSDMP